MAEDEIQISNNAADHRYELRVEGHLALLEYQQHGDRIRLVHTEVPSELEGRGIGGRLARHALEEAKAGQLTVVPTCPFVAEYIKRHQEYLDLVDPAVRAQLT